MKLSRPVVAMLLVGILLAMALLALGTRQGIGINSDAVAYLATARNLLDGHGLVTLYALNGREAILEPLTHWPPFYPVLLTVGGVIGLDPAQTAHWLNLLLLGLNMLLAGFLVYRATSGSVGATLAGVLGVSSSVNVLMVHSTALTEPLFICLSLGGLGVLSTLVERESSRPALVLIAAGLTALAFLTRYIGAALVATGVIGIVFLGRQHLRRRLGDALLFMAIGAGPAIAWLVWSIRAQGNAGNRPLVFHPVAFSDLKTAVFTALTWLFPQGVVEAAGLWLLVLLGGLGVYVVLFRRKSLYTMGRYLTERRLALLLIFIVSYLALLTLSISFFDAYTEPNVRILLPLYIVSVVLVVSLVSRWFSTIQDGERKRRATVIVFTLIAALAAVNGIQEVDWTIRNSQTGEDLTYTSAAWQHSEVITAVKELSPRVPIASNGADAIYIISGRLTWFLPLQQSPISQQVNTTYEEEANKLRQLLVNQGGLVIYFDAISRRYFPTEEELREAWSLQPVEVYSDGTIYRIED